MSAESPPIHTALSAQPGREPRAALAAFLSFLFPGLGQAYNGDVGLAWMLAGPIVILALVGVALGVIASAAIMARLLDTRFLMGLIVLDLSLLAWRLVAIAQAHSSRGRFTLRGWPTWATSLIVVLTVAMHALPAFYAVKAIDTLNTVAGSDNGQSHGQLGGVPGLSIIPVPSNEPDPRRERINVLLVGIDSSPLRTQALTDTMLVVSLDPETGRSAMISVPRDLYGVPLPDGRVYDAKLNSLMTFASQRPTEFPAGGPGTLKQVIGDLLGVKIHYFAAINLFGFKDAVDAIGGIDITVQRAINDPFYRDEFRNKTGFYLAPGTYHMDGHTALAYVRSRKGYGDNDFTRADRQQQLLTALRAQLTAGNLVLALPGLLDAVKNTIATDIPSARFPELARVIQDADVDHLRRVVLMPPKYMTSASDPVSGYILIPDFEAIRHVGHRLLTTPDSTPQASPSPSP